MREKLHWLRTHLFEVAASTLIVVVLVPLLYPAVTAVYKQVSGQIRRSELAVRCQSAPLSNEDKDELLVAVLSKLDRSFGKTQYISLKEDTPHPQPNERVYRLANFLREELSRRAWKTTSMKPYWAGVTIGVISDAQGR